MSQIRLIRVFLSSPGDVTEERQIALEVIERLPNRPAFREKVTFRVIAWDKPGAGTPMRATLTPQEAINKGLPRPSECDLVVVLFWSRMGTPFTLDGQDYQSGTHWELLDALQSDRPQTVMYRRNEKKLFEANDNDGQEQYRRVETFFKSDLFFDPDDGAIRRGVNTYKTPDDFRHQFETHLEELVVELLLRPAPEAPSEPGPENTPNIITVTATPWIGSPFPGLRAFTPADAPIYFGRGQETDALVQRVAANRFVAVVGASGSGKSSLVGAGLIPRLKANAIHGSQDWKLPEWNGEVRQWVGLRFTPGEVGDNPFMALALKLAPLTGDTPRELADRVTKHSAALTESCGQLFRNKPDWAEVLIFIDQFEELFTLVHHQYVAPFVDLLETAIESKQIRLVTTLRADFYARCVEVPKLADILEETTFPLAAPTQTALYEMISRPAEQAGLEFEKGLPERILQDTGKEPGTLALMAYALDELYHAGADDQRLTEAEYETLGGVQGAIGKRAEAIFSALDSEAQDALSTVFREIVEVDERGEPTRRRAELRVVAPDLAAKRLVEALTGERARLLVQDKDVQGRPIVEVAHEALLRQWPRLRQWIETEQGNLRQRRQIQQAAQEWEVHGRAPDYLLVGSRLDDADRWLKGFTAGQLEWEFIQASVAEAKRVAQQRQAEQEEKLRLAREAAENARRAEVAERERAEAQRDRAVRYRRWAQITGGFLVLAIMVMVGALLAANEASSRRAEAQSAQATSVAQGATVEFRATISSLAIGNDFNYFVWYLQKPEYSVTLMPTDIVATATTWALLAQPRPRKVNAVDMMMVPVGCFMMGSTTRGSQMDELPVHRVCFTEPFWIDQYEVTQDQFARFRGVANLESEYQGSRRPREQVTWFEARDFCQKRGARLPTEAEWEYAARGPYGSIYPWGNEFIPANAVWGRNKAEGTAEVGSKPAGVSWVGVYDMSGNVWEWVSSRYMDYPYNTRNDRENLERTDGTRVLRGGAWDDLKSDAERTMRATTRGHVAPGLSSSGYGFRCALSE